MRKIIESAELINSLERSDFLSQEVYDELFDIKNIIDRAPVKYRLLERAKMIGMKGYVEKIISQREREEKEKEKEQRKNQSMMTIENITNFFPDKNGKSYTQMACGSWIAREDGVYSSESSSIDKIACYHPIMPVKRLVNIETGEEQITLAFKRDGIWREITVPKVEIATARAITNLSRFGIQVTSENARLLVKYLADLESWNSDIIEVQHSTGKLGWHDDNTVFVPYDLSIQFDGENRFKSLYASITESGDYFKWVSLMKELRCSGRLEPRLSLAASFASVLVPLLDALPFIVDFHGQTEGGKTVTINVAASVWGNPAPGNLVGNFRATDASLETRADMLNNFPMILDDTKNASQFIKDNYETLIYNLCNGKGKGRSTKDYGAARENTWKNVVICNGENPISEYAESGGAINRIIEVECSENIYQDPVRVSETVLKNYGFAGRVFIGYIKQKSIYELKEMQKQIQENFSKENFMQKQILAISILLLADKLATECIFMDGKNLTIEDVKSIPASKSKVTEGQRCYDFVLDALSVYSQHFDVQYNVDQWGIPKEREDDGSVYAYFYVPPFEALLKKNGFSRKAFCSWAMKRGLLKHNANRDTFLKKDNGRATRFIAVKIVSEMLEDEQYSMEFTSADGVAVPFS